LFAPRSAPRVLDFPVVLAISAVADSEDTMIKIGATSTAENARFVKLKARLIGFNGNGHWLTVNGGAQSVFSVGHILISSDLGISRGSARRSLASAIFSGVGISSFSAKTVSLNVFKGVVHKTTRASEISITERTIHELLFRERGQMAMFKLNNAFNGASGRERPARTALTLILDTSDSAFGHPIKRASGISANTEIIQSSHSAATAKLGLVTIVDVLEFSVSEIGEFVQFNFPRVVAGVVGGDEIVVSLEDTEFVEKFFRGI